MNKKSFIASLLGCLASLGAVPSAVSAVKGVDWKASQKLAAGQAGDLATAGTALSVDQNATSLSWASAWNGSLLFPNGLALSSDGKLLMVPKGSTTTSAVATIGAPSAYNGTDQSGGGYVLRWDDATMKGLEAFSTAGALGPNAPKLCNDLLTTKLGKEVFIDRELKLRSKDGKYFTSANLSGTDQTPTDKAADAFKLSPDALTALVQLAEYDPATCSYESLSFKNLFIDREGKLRNNKYMLSDEAGNDVEDSKAVVYGTNIAPNGVAADFYRNELAWSTDLANNQVLTEKYIKENNLQSKTFYLQSVKATRDAAGAKKSCSCLISFDGKYVILRNGTVGKLADALESKDTNTQVADVKEVAKMTGMKEDRFRKGGVIWWRNASTLVKTGVIGGPVIAVVGLGGLGAYLYGNSKSGPKVSPRSSSTPRSTTPTPGGGAF